jgi:hypothetical protein
VISLNESEEQFILRMREFKLARRSTLLHIREVMANLPHEVKAPIFDVAHADKRRELAMFSRMV